MSITLKSTVIVGFQLYLQNIETSKMLEHTFQGKIHILTTPTPVKQHVSLNLQRGEHNIIKMVDITYTIIGGSGSGSFFLTLGGAGLALLGRASLRL